MLKRFNKLSYHIKLFLIFSLLSAVVGVVFAAVSYIYIRNNIREGNENSLRQTADTGAAELRQLLINMDMLASQTAADRTVQEVMARASAEQQKKNYFDTAIVDSNSVTARLGALNSPLLLAERISLFNDQGDYLHYGILHFTQVDATAVVKEYQLDRRIQEKENGFILLPPQADPWNGSTELRVETFALLREIFDLRVPTFPCVGYVLIQKPAEELDSLCVTGDEARNLMIYDPQNQRVVAPSGLTLPDTEELEKNGGVQSGKVLFSDDGKYVYCAVETNSPWVVISWQTKASFTEAEILLRNYILLVIGFFFLGSSFLIYKITRSLTQPIRHIVSRLDDITMENTSLNLQFQRSNDEFLLLDNALETTIKRLAETSRREIQAQANATYSHVLAMQAQMNPHFLCNTLMALSGLMQEGEMDKANQMCVRLSAMLHYAAYYKQQKTTIAQECQFTADYLSLMKVRYEEFLTYSIEKDEALDEVVIPKLILQPIVENCFKHGFGNMAPPYRVGIQVICKDGGWQMVVTDNGCGFDPDYLAEFEKTIADYEQLADLGEIVSQSQIGGIGLRSIYVRMKLYYHKEPFVFRLENLPEGGGRVTIGKQFDKV